MWTITWEGANCLNMTGDEFYPERGTAQKDAVHAKAICLGTDGVHSECVWRDECLEQALLRKDRHGVWGGMSVRDRDKEKARRRKDALQQIITENDQELITMPDLTKPPTRKRPAVAATQRKAAGGLARFADAKKDGGRLLPSIKRHLLGRPQDQDRHHDLIHVSALVKDFCPRATTITIAAARAGVTFPRPAPHFQLDNIFAEGNSIHDKYRAWLWDMGVLWGRWQCYACEHTWFGKAPTTCEACGAVRHALRYREVPMQDKEHALIGHADGEVRDDDEPVLIEIKSIGEGTIRVEAPKMLGQYTRAYTDESGKECTWLDHAALWRDLHRPFPSHLRQGVVYLYLRNLAARELGWPPVKKLTFIYEYKPTQSTKEFTIGADDEYVVDLLEQVKDVLWALENNTLPTCLKGRKERCSACKALDDVLKDTDEPTQPAAEARGGDHPRQGDGREPSVTCAPPARRPTRVARRPDRPRGPRPDGPAGSVHSLGRLLRGATRDGVD